MKTTSRCKKKINVCMLLITYLFSLISFGSVQLVTTQLDSTSLNPKSIETQKKCRNYLTQRGLSKEQYLCTSMTDARWRCSQNILDVHHSIEVVKDLCLSTKVTEVTCINPVLERNFNPYIAKNACRLKN